MVSTGLSAFTQGFAEGFAQAGGVQKASSWLGRNIAGGEYYDPQRDPLYQQELQQARQLGTPEARQQVIQKYGDFVDTGEQTPEQYFFQPAEGTPQYADWKTNQYNLEQKKLITEAMPEQLQQQIDKGEMTLAQAAQTLAQQKIKTRWMPRQYQLNYDKGSLEKALMGEEVTRSEELTEVYPEQLRLGLAQKQLGVDTGRFQLNRSQELFPIEKESAQTQLEQQQFNLDQAQTMAPYKENLAELNVKQQQANLNRAKTENDYLERQLQQQLRAGELQNVGAEINNRIRELQAEKGEMLLPYEIEQVKNNIYRQELQNRGLELDVGFQEETQPFRIRQEEIRTDTAAENLEQIRTTNEFMRRTLDDRVGSVEQQRINDEINVALAEEQLERQRQLTPLEVQQIENRILSQKLQNKAQEIQNKYQPRLYDAQLKEAEQALTAGAAGGSGEALSPTNPKTYGLPGDWDNVSTSDFINNTGAPIFSDANDYLRYPTGEYVIDMETGNYYRYDTNRDSYRPVHPSDTEILPEINVPEGPSWLDQNAPWLSNVLRLAPGGDSPQWGQINNQQTQQPAQGTQQTQQQAMTVTDAVQQFREKYPNKTAGELAGLLNMQSEDWKQTRMNNGVPINAVIGRLRQMASAGGE